MCRGVRNDMILNSWKCDFTKWRPGMWHFSHGGASCSSLPDLPEHAAACCHVNVQHQSSGMRLSIRCRLCKTQAAEAAREVLFRRLCPAVQNIFSGMAAGWSQESMLDNLTFSGPLWSMVTGMVPCRRRSGDQCRLDGAHQLLGDGGACGQPGLVHLGGRPLHGGRLLQDARAHDRPW